MLEMYKKVVMDNYANFNGRARRKEYWMFVLANVIISIPFKIIDKSFNWTYGAEAGISELIFNLLILLPTIGVAIRRMHDVDKSGWHILIPFYNLYLFCKEGTAGMNQYGADPKNQLEELDEIGKE